MRSAPRGLLIGYGNPGRRDDGLGPALADRIERSALPNLDVDSDYQLTVEDSHNAAGHDFVVFADAAVSGPEPFSFSEIQPAGDPTGFSSHSVPPAGVLALARGIFGAQTRGFVLGIRGYEFDPFQEHLSERAALNLEKAATFFEDWIRHGASETESAHEEER